MIKIVLLVLFYFTFPFLIIYLCKCSSAFKKMGSILLAYGFGLLLSISGILPRGSEGYKLALKGGSSLPAPEMETLLASGVITPDDYTVNAIASAQDMMTTVIIPIAFPLLLFSLNIRRWLKHAKTGFLSMLLALVSVAVIIASGFLIFENIVPDSWKVAGMLVSVYTGATANMASLSVALDVDPSLFLMTNTYDIIMGALTIIFFITAGPKVFRAILPRYKFTGESEDADQAVAAAESFDDYSGMFRKERLLPLVKAFGMSLLIVAVSVGIAVLLFPPEALNPVAILLITTLAVAASLMPWINRIEKSFQLGMYFILVFSLVVASMADFSVIFSRGYLGLFAFVIYAYFGSLLLHLVLSKLFRVNADDYLITTTAFVYSPPFVPIVAAALKNKEVIVTGITVGVVGYIIGNYMGVGLAYFLKGL